MRRRRKDLAPKSPAISTRLRFDFPARADLPPLTLWWYDGNPKDTEVKPFRPPSHAVQDIVKITGNLPDNGCLLIGDQGKMLANNLGSSFLLRMGNDQAYRPGLDHEAVRATPQTIPRSPGHYDEWFRMMRDGTPAYANFDVASGLTEIVLLGVVALRVGAHQEIKWNSPHLTSPNCPAATQYVKRENRPGWKF